MEAVSFLAAVVALGVLCQKIIEFLKTMVTLNGNVTRLAAWIVGAVLAYAFNLDPATAITASIGVPIRDFHEAVDFLVAGLFVASAAGYLADRAGRSNSTVPVVVTAAKYDEGYTDGVRNPVPGEPPRI